MGKKHKSEIDVGIETVSNLDTKMMQDPPSKEETVKKGLMPAKSKFKHTFSEGNGEIMIKKKKGFIKKYRDFSFANDFPAKCICLLIITGLDEDDKEQEFYGTGFFISPRIIITAGHNVFFRSRWAKRILAVPGADGPYTPYGSEIAAELISTNNWVRDGRDEHDYGALILGSDNLFNRVNAYFQFLEIKQKGPIMVWGYPISKKFKQITLHGVSSNITPFIMEYNLPTEKGESGSPVFIVLNNQIVVVAVHTMGGSPSSGVRLNPNVIKVWNAWTSRPKMPV